MYFKLLWGEFATLPEVEAIALGGSRAGANYDEKSDYDLYIYCTSIPDESVRKRILEKCCQYMEIGNSFWELEDDCTLKDGVDIDILYRNIGDFSQAIQSVVEDHTAYEGKYENELLLLSPVAVKTELQRQHISKEMIEYGFEKAVQLGYKAVIVEGNPQNYRARGFQTSADFGIMAGKTVSLPSPECLMVKELVKGALPYIKGVVDYSDYEFLT